MERRCRAQCPVFTPLLPFYVLYVIRLLMVGQSVGGGGLTGWLARVDKHINHASLWSSPPRWCWWPYMVQGMVVVNQLAVSASLVHPNQLICHQGTGIPHAPNQPCSAVPGLVVRPEPRITLIQNFIGPIIVIFEDRHELMQSMSVSQWASEPSIFG